MRRVLIAQAPTFWPDDRPPELTPMHVGVLPFSAPSPWMALIVKVASSWGDQASVDERGRRRLVPCVPPLLHVATVAPGERTREAVDFIPLKDSVDVSIRGHVGPFPERRDEAEWHLHTRVSIDAFSRPFAVLVRGRQRTELAPESVLGADGRRGFDLGSHAPPAPDRFHHDDPIDGADYQTSSRALQVTGIPLDLEIVLEGLSPRAETLSLALPPLVPAAFVERIDERENEDVRLVLDTLEIDLDAEVVTQVYRGRFMRDDFEVTGVDRIVVAMVPADEILECDAADADDPFWRAVLRELPRGSFRHATELADAAQGREAPPLDPEELAMARMESFDQNRGPTPRMPLEEFARNAATLAEQSEPRQKTFERLGIDEHIWNVEEIAWTHRFATMDAEREEAGRDAVRFGELFVAAQDAIVGKDAEVSPADFGRLSARLEARNPAKVLEAAGLSTGSFMRLGRRIDRMAHADPTLLAVISDAKAEEAALLDAEGDDEDEGPPTEPGGRA